MRHVISLFSLVCLVIGSSGTLGAETTSSFVSVRVDERLVRVADQIIQTGRLPDRTVRFHGHLQRFGRFTAEILSIEASSIPGELIFWRGILRTRRGKRDVLDVAGSLSASSRGPSVVFSFSQESNRGVLYFYEVSSALVSSSTRVAKAPHYLLAPLLCGLNHAVKSEVDSNLARAEKVGGVHRDRGALPTLRLAVDTDTEWTMRFGSRAEDTVKTLIHRANVFYERDLGISLEQGLTQIRTSTSPYPELFTQAELLLFTFTGYSIFVKEFRESDMGVLLTGKELNNQTIGVAFTSVTCRLPFLSRGVVQHVNAAVDHVILAHEIGHSIGADHTEDGIMTTALGAPAPDRFSIVSQREINSYLDEFGSCLSGNAEDGSDNTTIATEASQKTERKKKRRKKKKGKRRKERRRKKLG